MNANANPTETATFLEAQGWRQCAPAIGYPDYGPCYAAPWDTSKLYALTLALALRVCRFALETGAQATPTCDRLERHEIERARIAHARMLGKVA